MLSLRYATSPLMANYYRWDSNSHSTNDDNNNTRSHSDTTTTTTTTITSTTTTNNNNINSNNNDNNGDLLQPRVADLGAFPRALALGAHPAELRPLVDGLLEHLLELLK